MDETPAALPLGSTDAPALPIGAPPPTLPRWYAALQVLLVCGIPTQVVIFIVLLRLGVPVVDDNGISFQFFATLSLIDTAFVAVLIRIFLSLSGETPAQVLIGDRKIGREILRGLALLPVSFIAVTAIVLGLHAVAPWTHTVPQNPYEAFMRTPIEAALFIVVLVLAGGVREEIQRAFILHRFEQRLGGIRAGLVIFSFLIFGALHYSDQGLDAAIAIGLLGLFWGILYVKRRSMVASMVNHAAFDAAQVLQSVFLKSLGG